MQFYIAKNGNQAGPFSLAQISAQVSAGTLGINDLAWAEGMPSWVTVAEILRQPGLPPAGAPPALQDKPKTGVGLFSLIIAVLGIPIWFTILVIAAAGARNHADSHSNLMMMVGLALFAMGAVNLVGAVLGIVAVVDKSRRTVPAILGLIGNGLEVLAIALLTIIGLSAK